VNEDELASASKPDAPRATERLWFVLSWIPLLHLVLLLGVLWWWFNIFEPSRVKNVSGLLLAFYSFAAIHLLVMALTVVLTVRSINLVRRAGSIEDTQKGLWIVGIFAFSVAAFPVIQLLLRRSPSVPCRKYGDSNRLMC